MPGGFVCSASLKGVPTDRRRETLPASGRSASSSRRSSGRSTATHAPEGLALDDLSVLGPIIVLKLKFTPEDYAGRLVAEMWLYPDGSRILELSTKCRPTEAFRWRPRAGLPGRARARPGRAADEDPERAGVLRRATEGDRHEACDRMEAEGPTLDVRPERGGSAPPARG